MCFTFIKTEVECTLVLSECTAIVVVTCCPMSSWLLLAIDFLSIPEGSYSSWMIISSSSEQSIDFMIKDR